MADRKRAEIAGTSVVWNEAEPVAGAPVLYVHGNPSTPGQWDEFIARTGGIAPDLPGFGESGKSGGFDYSIRGYGDFLEAFVDHLGLDRFALVVHDWGVVGLELAQRRPEAVERLVVMDAVPLLPGYRWHPVARIWRTPVAGELFQGLSSRWAMKRVLRRTEPLPDATIDALVEATWPNIDHGTQRAVLKLYRSGDPDVLARAGERLGTLTCPALVVWGEDDFYLPNRFAHAFADALGGPAEVELVPRAGHWPWVGRGEVVERVAAFLSG